MVRMIDDDRDVKDDRHFRYFRNEIYIRTMKKWVKIERIDFQKKSAFVGI